MNRFQEISAISDALASEDHSTYLVGGAVRDKLLGLEAKDLDLATSARPDDVERLLTGVANSGLQAGKEFGTYIAVFDENRYEITTFRGDAYDGESRKPVVTYADTIEADLSRRDFTINAMAIRLSGTWSGDLIDPFHGADDLRERVLRTPGPAGESFRDDPLRMIRAARFIASFGLSPHYNVTSQAEFLSSHLQFVSTERIRDELVKLLTVEDPTEGLKFLADLRLSDYFLPELNALRMDNDGDSSFKDVFTHTLAVIRNTEPEAVLRLSALFHDIAKPATFKRENKRVSFHYHEVIGAEMTEKIMRRMKFDNDTIDDVIKLVRLHLRVHTADDWTDRAVRRYIRDAGPLLDKLNALQRADVTTRNKGKSARLERKMDALEARIEALQAIEGVEPIKPPLNGKQVMEFLKLAPGPIVGQALSYLLEYRLDNGPTTEEEAYNVLSLWHEAYV